MSNQVDANARQPTATPAPAPAPQQPAPTASGPVSRDALRRADYDGGAALLAPNEPAAPNKAPRPSEPMDRAQAVSVQFDRPKPPATRSFAYATVEASTNVGYKGTFGPADGPGAQPGLTTTATTSWDSADGPKLEVVKQLYAKEAVAGTIAVTEVSIAPSASLPALSADKGADALAKVGIEGEVKYTIGLSKQTTGFSKLALTLIELKKGEWSGPSVELMPVGVRQQVDVDIANPKGKVSGEATLAPKLKVTPNYGQIALRLGLDKAARALAPAAIPLALAAGGVLTWAAYLKSITDYQDDKTFVTQARVGADAFCESYLAGVLGTEGQGEAFTLGQARFEAMLDKVSKDPSMQGVEREKVRALLRDELQKMAATFRKDTWDNLRPKALRAAYGRWAEGKPKDATEMPARDRFVRTQLGIGLDETVDGASVSLPPPVEAAKPESNEKTNPIGHHMAKLKEAEKASATGIMGRLPALRAEAQKLGNQLYGWIHQTERPLTNRAGAIERHNAGMALSKRADGLEKKLGKNPSEADLNSYGANAAQDWDQAARTYKEGLALCPPGWAKR